MNKFTSMHSITLYTIITIIILIVMITVDDITLVRKDSIVRETHTMKAIVCDKYGLPDVLELKEIKKPLPKDNEVLIRNYASSINTVDIMMRSGKAPGVLFWAARKLAEVMMRAFMMGIRKPRQKIPGYSFSGEIGG